MSLLKNILLNRWSQVTCLVIPKHTAVLGRRYTVSKSDAGTVTKPLESPPEQVHHAQTEDTNFENTSLEDELEDTSFENMSLEDELVDKSEPDAYFPNLDVLQKSFGGVKYADLPFVKMLFTRNNVKMGAHSADGSIAYSTKTAGALGFKSSEKRSTVAAQTVGFAIGDDIIRKNLTHVRVELVGHHPSRLPAMIGLQQAGVNIVSISDRTILKFWDRPPKPKKQYKEDPDQPAPTGAV